MLAFSGRPFSRFFRVVFLCRTLLELNLSECNGTDDSFGAVAAAVETNGTLSCLIYSGNQLGVDTITEIEFAMGRAKRSIRELVGQVSQATLKRVECLTGSKNIVPEVRRTNLGGHALARQEGKEV